MHLKIIAYNTYVYIHAYIYYTIWTELQRFFFPKNLLRCELMKKEKKCNQAAQIINRGEQSQLGTVFCFLSHILKIFP